MQLRESISRTFFISIVMALYEAYFNPSLSVVQGNVISPYHTLLLLIGIIAGFDRNLKILIANTLTYSVLEDALFWLFKFELPFSWGSEYIVVDHVPIYYIPYMILSIVLYRRGLNDKNRL